MGEKILLRKEEETRESNLILQDTTYAEQLYHPLKRKNNKMRKKTKTKKAKKKNNKKMKLKKVTVAATAADSNAKEEKDETPMLLDHFVNYYSLLLNSEEVPAPDGSGGTREECIVEGSLGMVSAISISLDLLLYHFSLVDNNSLHHHYD